MLAGCGGSGSGGAAAPAKRDSTSKHAGAGHHLRTATARRTRAANRHEIVEREYPEALVTAETVNRLFAVDLQTGHIVANVQLAADPENVAAWPGVAVVASARSGTVSVLEPFPHVRRTISGFGSPHIVAMSPDGQYAYVTDDTRGTVNVIELENARLVSRVPVGVGAHHMAFSPDQRRLWVALGETARTIVILDTSDIAHPRVVGRFDPGSTVHDLLFSPDGQRVWLTSASGPDVTVIDARTHHVLFRVPAGRAPQHLAFAGRYAYVTSGYGGTIEQVALSSGKVLRRVQSPYGSFELDAGDGYVVTSSLLTGTLAVFTPGLRRLRTVQVAPVTRDVALSIRYGR